MGFCLRWLGILLGAVALFSLAQKLYEFATAPVIGDLLPYYRASIHPLVSVFSDALEHGTQAIGLAWPLLSADFVIIYFALGFILLVLYVSDDWEWKRSGEERITFRSMIGRFAISFLWPVILPVALFFIFDAHQSALSTWVSAIAKMLGSAVLLLAVNSCFSTLL
jgi:hypothetical protein